jgi:SAM-dependent methyltransferase
MNAQAEGVADQIEFIKGSASRLPFKDNEFDLLASCLTFHEVQDESDKKKVLKEAFRVLKKGGEFIFLDLFLDEKIYGRYNDFVGFIEGLGLAQVEFAKLDEMIKLPGILRQKRVLGNALVIKGIK